MSAVPDTDKAGQAQQEAAPAQVEDAGAPSGAGTAESSPASSPSSPNPLPAPPTITQRGGPKCSLSKAWFQGVIQLCLHEFQRIDRFPENTDLTQDDEGRLSAIVWRVSHLCHEFSIAYAQQFGPSRVNPGPSLGSYGPDLTDEQKKMMFEKTKEAHAAMQKEKDERQRVGGKEHLRRKMEEAAAKRRSPQK